MHVFKPALHDLHHPRKDYSDGLPPFDHLEVPARVDAVLKGFAAQWDVTLVEVEEEAEASVRAVHDPSYVEWLKNMVAGIEPGHEYIPALFGMDLSRAPLPFQGGMYCREVGTPIGSGSLRAALNAAAAAEQAAAYVAASGQDAVALCRPPGHHAGSRRYGGYCLFNNASIAARHLAGSRGRGAVVDVDYHLGEGSLELATADVPYYSLHADPWTNYPYLDGAEALSQDHAVLEVLPEGIEGAAYVQRLEALLEQVRALEPRFAVVSLGFDTLGEDYIQDMPVKLREADYRDVGGAIARLDTPVLVVLEGGYDLPRLATCARCFAEGFGTERRVR